MPNMNKRAANDEEFENWKNRHTSNNISYKRYFYCISDWTLTEQMKIMT